MGQDRPGSVTTVSRLLAALIAIYGVAALLTIVFDDELVDAWTAAHADSSSVEPPAFVAVAVVMYVVVAVLVLVLLRFLHARLAWARVVLTGLVVVVLLATLAVVRTGPPVLFQVVLVLGLVLDVAVLVSLWRRGTGAYLAGGAASPQR